MPVTTPSHAAQSVLSKYEDIATKHNESIEQVDELHEVAVEEMVPVVLQELGVLEDVEAAVNAFLDDRATLFRFYRRSRYSIPNALSLLTSTLTWRLRTDLDSLSLSSLHPLYVSPPARPPLFWCNSKCKDKLGRPVGVISLRSLERVAKEESNTGLDECREYIVGCMESARRYLSHLYAKGTSKSRTIDVHKTASFEPKPVQLVIIFSLQSSGMANLELELLPFLLDLLKNHYPGMVGAVYIVHYGWVHSGMWALAKRVLPQQALARIFFPNEAELPDHFDMNRLPLCLGGEWEVTLSEETNDVMKKFARPGLQGVLYTSSGVGGGEERRTGESHSAPSSPRGISGTSSPALGRSSRTLSRRGSFDSLVEEFYSTENTPWHLTPRQSQTPTPHTEPSQNPFGQSFSSGTSSPTTTVLRMTPTAAKKLHQLQMTRGGPGSRTRASSELNRKTEEYGGWRSTHSPVMSRGNSPNRARRRTLTGQGGKSVHYLEAGAADPLSEGKEEAIKRKGSLRDFRLLQGDFASSELGIDEGSGSEESDRSGKVGESTREEVKGNDSSKPGSGGFFARWRRESANEHVDKGAREEEGGDSLTEMEPNALPSPQLQVPDIEEPPISGYGSLSEANDLLSRRTRKYSSLPGHVSPYNASNPYYGYPAYPVMNGISSGEATRRSGALYNPSNQHGQDAQRLQYRKRKRDLLRTLMYLFVLRLLSLHRGVRNQALVGYRGLIRAVRVGGMADDRGEEEEWREANLRYHRLRTATYSRHHEERQQQLQQQQQAGRQAQPLVQLGFRKRYAFFILFLFVFSQRNWRNRIHLNLKEVLTLAGIGKVGLDQVEQTHDCNLTEGVSDAKLLGLESDPATTFTGLHLRKRLGWS